MDQQPDKKPVRIRIYPVLIDDNYTQDGWGFQTTRAKGEGYKSPEQAEEAANEVRGMGP